MSFVNPDTAFLSITYDGVSYGQEAQILYSVPGQYTQRFIANNLGYVENKFAFRVRWVTYGRMAFATAKMIYS